MTAAKMEFPQLGDIMRNKVREVRLFIAAQLQTNRGLLFDSSGARNGHKPWAAPLLRVGQPLSSKGSLRNSLGPGTGSAGPSGFVRFSGDLISIGTSLAYAKTVCKGAVIHAKPGGVLAIPLPQGKRATPVAKSLRKSAKAAGHPGVMFVKKVTIPARDFERLTTADENEIGAALEKKIAEVLK